jgi:hypothetical protein
MQNYLSKLSSLSDSCLFGLNLKVSENSNDYVPYLQEEIIKGLVTIPIGSSEFISVDLSKNRSLLYKKYLNPSEFGGIVNTISDHVKREYVSHLKRIEEGKNIQKVSFISSPCIFIRLNLSHIENKDREDILRIVEREELVKGIILESSQYENGVFVKFSVENKEKVISELDYIRKLKERKVFSKKVIVSDGVVSGKDIVDYYSHKADYVLISSLLFLEGPYVIDRLVREINSINKEEDN